jgi:cytidyltransferase-like protein
MMKKVVAVSGYFIFLHIGHIEYFEKARKLGDELLVILNNDEQQLLKYGKIIVPQEERKKVLEAIKWVDDVVISSDMDRTVCLSLQIWRPDIFAKGGDSTTENVPEQEICKELGIKIAFGLGAKIQSSSWLIKKIEQL